MEHGEMLFVGLSAAGHGSRCRRLTGRFEPAPLGRPPRSRQRLRALRAQRMLEHFQAKWIPVRIKRMRQSNSLERRSDPIGSSF
jgi:hypothetical protein